MLVRLAWRNIWRNPRRTAVILTAVVIGVWSMVFISALMRGMASQMMENGLSTLTGELQIHAKGYRSDPSAEKRMERLGQIRRQLERLLPEGSRWAERIRVQAVVNNARHSDGVTLVGIEPEAEAAVSFIGSAVREGAYLSTDSRHEILVGRALLDRFETRIGNKLVLMAQAADGEIASRAFRITGVFEAEMESTEMRFVFVHRSAGARLLRMGTRLSEIVIRLPKGESPEEAAQRLREGLPSDLDVASWQELLPLVNAYLTMMDGWILIWYGVTFVAMGFGIVNTLLMAVFERIREFGLVKALGMKPLRIVGQVLSESLMLLLLGSAAGVVLGVLTVLALSGGIDLSAVAAGAEYAGISRIIFPQLVFRDVAGSILVVCLLGCLVSLYPAIKAARITPVEAMAHN